MTAAKFHDALQKSGLQYAAMSWGGYNVFGDKASIDEIKRLHHLAGTVPALRDELLATRAKKTPIDN
jgi:hypothetical protein